MNKTYVNALREFEKHTASLGTDSRNRPRGAYAKWWEACLQRITILQTDSAKFHDLYTPVPFTMRECMFGISSWDWGILIPNSNRNPLPKCWCFADLPTLHFEIRRPLVLNLDQVLHLAAALNVGIQALKDLPD